MRRYFGIIITGIIVIAVIIAMSAAGNLELDRPFENEFAPNRSSYNPGPTGTRALYQLLEESGTPVSRWRNSYSSLGAEAKDAILVIVGPSLRGQKISEREAVELQSWISSGGRALILSRSPIEQFGDPTIHTKGPETIPDFNASPEQFIYKKSDELIAQPTELTRNVRGLALSGFATRMNFHPPQPAVVPGETKSEKDATAPSPEPSAPEPSVIDIPAGKDVGDYSIGMLYAPVIHLGDKDGAALADFAYDKGRVIFLSDPFVVANNGIAQGANLTLVMNILRSIGAPDRKIFFDEFHHGYRSESNPLFNYFRGAPLPWLLLQALTLSLLILFTYGRRFARPLPLPTLDRHSPLEFVSSMANLQQAAQARELALENIYPRFKARLCRRLGLSSRAHKDEIIDSARRRRFPISEIELRQTLSDAEMALAGEPLEDAQLIGLVSRMRRIISKITSK